MTSIIAIIMALIAALGLYPKAGYITEISDREIVIEDANGHLWVFEDEPEDLCVGDGISMIMYDNGTKDYIYDDAIVAIRYNGFIR